VTGPLVWVVTPVYNGERYLAECIESVLAQTYDNWRYVVVDNCSTDRTCEIVSGFADREPRVSLRRNAEFLPIIENWNTALGLLSPDAAYCKVVHADDTLFPECLARMVDVAERHPSVRVVSSYAMWGGEVRHEGVPYPDEVVPGPEICRRTLLGECYVFGSPSSLLLRAADVRSRPAFYDEGSLHADTGICFELLQEADLGFVHQVLTHTRVHEEAATATSVKVNTFHDAWLEFHLRYGRAYLSPAEYRRSLAIRVRRYAVFLAKSLLQGKFLDRRFRRHHLAALRRLVRIARAAAR
jgi:glycosyltransferase involved in cell wall biosynthesis